MDICNALYSPKPQMQYESDNSVKKNTTKKIKQQNRPNAERTCAETTVDEPISNHANDSRGSMAFTRVCVSVCLSVCLFVRGIKPNRLKLQWQGLSIMNPRPPVSSKGKRSRSQSEKTYWRRSRGRRGIDCPASICKYSRFRCKMLALCVCNCVFSCRVQWPRTMWTLRHSRVTRWTARDISLREYGYVDINILNTFYTIISHHNVIYFLS